VAKAEKSPATRIIDGLARIAPGLTILVRYRRQDLLPDLAAGLSVAAVALPVGVAYAELAGFNPAVGLYSSMLPLVAYALFGSSRQLIIGPDAATCALVAAAVAPLAAGDPAQYLSLSVTLTFLAGVLAIGASFLKLGVLADFLSRPILAGLMNGIALSIALGQIGKLLGFTIKASGIIPRFLEVAEKLHQTHWPTLAVGLGSFAVLLICPRLLPRVPPALLAMVLAGLAVALLGLGAHGVAIIGAVPAGLPALVIPRIPHHALKPLLGDAASIALISFTSLMLTARSFAAKNGYDIDADRDLAALGVANITAALSQGFAVSGADSRTAMNEDAGGRSQAAGLFAAAAIALVLIFATGPLRYVPQAALAAALVMAAYSLANISSVRSLWGEDKGEFAISIIATLGVVAVGSIDAILFAVLLVLLRFLRIVARPPCEVLGEVDGVPGFHSIERHSDAHTLSGICLLRFNSPLVFFNAAYFKRSVLEAVASAGPQLRWLVFDALPVTSHDVTGRYTLNEVEHELASRGIRIAFAGRETEITTWRRKKHFGETHPSNVRVFPTLRWAVRALQEELAKDIQAAAGGCQRVRQTREMGE
jgi:high affinity sulfate transporter 1